MKFSGPWHEELKIRYATTIEHISGSGSVEGVGQVQFYPFKVPIYPIMGFGVSEAKQLEIVLRMGAGIEYPIAKGWLIDGSITIDWRDGQTLSDDRGTYLLGIVKQF